MKTLGIVSDTHVGTYLNSREVQSLLKELRRVFSDVDEIIHAGDVCDETFINELQKIAPTRCVRGNMDHFRGKDLLKFSIGDYSIGVIHKPPKDLENFFKEKDINILIHGHTHQPVIQGTTYNTLVICPGSPTHPKAPPRKRGFKDPVARPTVIKLMINEEGHLSTYLINLNS